MIGWICLTVAIVASVVANGAFKIIMTSPPSSVSAFIALLAYPSVWIAAASCGILLGSYLLALSYLPLSVAYTAVTVLAMVGINVVAIVFFHEPLGFLKLVGITLAFIGVTIVMLSTVNQ